MKKISLLMLLFLSSCFETKVRDDWYRVYSVSYHLDRNNFSHGFDREVGLVDNKNNTIILYTDSLYDVGDTLRIIK